MGSAVYLCCPVFYNENYMVEMLFSLRFKSQLRRTRPQLVQQVDETMKRAIADAGGKITGERQVITVSFNEDSLGFWLDMLILIENLIKNMEQADDLHGYTLVLSRESQQAPQRLCNFLAACGGGVFLDQSAADGLSPYAHIENPGQWLAETDTPTKARHKKAGDFFRLKELKTFTPVKKDNAALWKPVFRVLGARPKQNVLAMGTAFSGRYGGLYDYCKKLNGDFPPLTVCFGSGGLNPLVDSWSPRIRALSGGPGLDEIDSLWELLFRERLRGEVSAFFTRKAERFFSMVLKFYINAALSHDCYPVLIVENIHLAEKPAGDLLLELYDGLKDLPKSGILVLGTCDEGIVQKKLRKWEQVFQQIITINGTLETLNLADMPSGLWEIAYALSLFGRFFPASLFGRLFEEEAKNPAMISRALSLLSALGAIENPRDPRPCLEDFTEQAERILGEKTGHIKDLVCGRLLSWVQMRKISPCFRFLTVITELGGTARLNDRLILSSIISDIINETPTDIELACKSELLEKIAGFEKAAIIRYIFETMRALILGSEEDIRGAFKETPPDCAAFPVLKAQVLVNLSGYYLGLRDYAKALETVKEAIMLSQGKDNFCLSQSYRLFSLVSLSRQQTGETIDYLGFAMANAEKSGNYHEMGVSAYYAATAQFLFGNLSKAIRLSRTACEHSLAAGRPGWADRSRFLEGRLAFEIGRYEEALDIFETLRNEPFDSASPEKDRIFAAWAYRARIYFQDPLTPKPETGGHDADLFEAEAAYLSGDYRKCAELSGTLGNPYSEDNYLFTEQPDWRSGFSQCELLYFTRGEIQDRMISVFHSLALCHLSAKGGEEALRNMQRLLRDERLSGMDPWDAFYFYAWYRIQKQAGAGQSDINTAVSMAFKRLQSRASRIEDIETRRQYLSRPYWNRALGLTAKEFKLI